MIGIATDRLSLILMLPLLFPLLLSAIAVSVFRYRLSCYPLLMLSLLWPFYILVLIEKRAIF